MYIKSNNEYQKTCVARISGSYYYDTRVYLHTYLLVFYTLRAEGISLEIFIEFWKNDFFWKKEIKILGIFRIF